MRILSLDSIQVDEPNPAGGADYLTNYTYNNFNKLTQVSMPRTMPGGAVVTQTRTLVYDATQQLTSVTQPESGVTTYTYDTAGHTKTKTDAKGNVVAYTYDTYDRVTQISRTPGAGSIEPDPLTTFAYDSPDSNPYLAQSNLAGRLAKITHGFGSVERFSYTVSGRMAAKTLSPQDTQPFIGVFTYNNEGQMTSYTPSCIYTSAGAAIAQGTRQWSYDSLGRPLGLTYVDANNLSTALTSNAAYWPSGKIKSYDRAAVLQYNAGNDLAGIYQSETLNFQYDVNGRIAFQSGGSWAPSISYVYDGAAGYSRLVNRIELSAGNGYVISSYAYDSLGRLSTAGSSGVLWGQSFVYDPFGNLLQQNVTSGSAPALNLTVDPSTNHISTSGFTYDAAGNLAQSPAGSSPNTFSYDSQNRMTRASYSGGAALNYYYGANGERLYDGSHWHFYGPDGAHLETLTANATGGTFGSTVEELHFAGRLVFQDYYPVVTDRLGSVVLMGKGNGATYQSFYPYGQAIAGLASPADAPPPNYGSVTYPASGSVSDVAFGTYHRDGALDYALNRYDDPARGRFTTPDPGESATLGNPLSWNRYAYTEGAPINFNDPQGLSAIPIGEKVFWPGEPEPTSPWGGPYFWGFGPYVIPRPLPLDPPSGKLSKDCLDALRAAGQSASAVKRARNAEATLEAAAAETGIDWTILAAIGIRESGFQNGSEKDGAGVGVGVFQITVSRQSGVTAGQAGNLAWAADWAANFLQSNQNQILGAIPWLDGSQLSWMTVASFNTGAQGQINRFNNGQSPDYHTAPFGQKPNVQYHNDYGSNVLAIASNCFP